MLRLTSSMAVMALAGCASTSGWHALRIDGSSETSFKESVAVFQKRLPPVQRQVFEMSLQDVWNQGVEGAKDERYTATDYFQKLDGLTYREILRFADPTGIKTKERYRAARAHWSEYLASQRARLPARVSTGLPPPRQGSFSNDQGNPTLSQWGQNGTRGLGYPQR